MIKEKASKLNYLPEILTYGVLLIMACRSLYISNLFGVNVFFWDQWDFFMPLFRGDGFIAEYMKVHWPHRMGVGFWIMDIMLNLTSWDNVVLGYVSVVHLVTACFLALFIYKKFFGINYGALFIPVLILNFGQASIYTTNIDLSLNVVPLVLILAIGASFFIQLIWLRYLVILTLNFFAIYTGFSIFSGLIVPVAIAFELYVLILKKEKKRVIYFTCFILLLSVFSMFSYFIDYKIGFSSKKVAELGFFKKIIQLSEYYMNLYVSFFGVEKNLYIKILSFSVILILSIKHILFNNLKSIIIKLNHNNYDVTKHVILLYLGAFSFVFSVFNTIGRSPMGVESAFSSRYIPFLLPGFLAFYISFQHNEKLKKNKKYIIATIIALFFIGGELKFSKNKSSLARFAAGKSRWIQSYLIVKDIDKANELASFQIYPWRHSYNRINHQLKYLEENKLSFFKDNQ